MQGLAGDSKATRPENGPRAALFRSQRGRYCFHQVKPARLREHYPAGRTWDAWLARGCALRRHSRGSWRSAGAPSLLLTADCRKLSRDPVGPISHQELVRVLRRGEESAGRVTCQGSSTAHVCLSRGVPGLDEKTPAIIMFDSCSSGTGRQNLALNHPHVRPLTIPA